MVKIKPEVAILITAEPKSAKYGKVFGPKPSDHLVRLYVNVKFVQKCMFYIRLSLSQNNAKYQADVAAEMYHINKKLQNNNLQPLDSPKLISRKI